MSAPGGPTGHFCTHCGAALDPAAAFCGHCAAPTGATPDASGQAPPTAPTPIPPMGPTGPPPGPTGPPHGPGWVSPDANTPPAGMPYVAPPPPGPVPAGSPAPAGRGALTGVLIGVGALAVLVIGILVYVAVNSGSDGETADTVPPQTVPTSATVGAPALSSSAPVSVTLDPSTIDRPREHPLTLTANQAGTVVVTSDQAFEPTVALVGPNGSEVPTEGVALADGGAAVTIHARGAGEYALLVSGFSSGQAGYDVEFRPSDTFVTPSQLAVGDCVEPLAGEEMESVSGFFVVDCAGAHRGQVFERASGASDTGQAAQERCDTARNQRVPLGGRVNWFAYWGDGLTCVLISGSGDPLTGSLVTG